jgi:CO/xanthine dehydrogenase Mo-binding subunit/aerobic-type carbon monoxide dehydrogenase small subunit (CoxS/CutS family)
MSTIELTVNGRAVRLEIEPTTPLLSVLREELGLRGSRFGCGLEQCGACMVLIDGEPAYSCAREIGTLAGHAVTTVEALSQDGTLHPLQQAFLDEQAGQCGYCLSGILISASALLARNTNPTRAEIVAALDRHLCRCGVHNRVIRALCRVGKGEPKASRAHAVLHSDSAYNDAWARRAEEARLCPPYDAVTATPLPQALVDNPRLDRWIAFEEGGRVRLATGKVEIGQGVVTALAQIAAEELDVAPERLRVVSGETPQSPSEGFTSGSNSVVLSGSAIRLVCAEVRALFVACLAEKLACAPGEIAVEDGRFLRAGQETGHDYWSLGAEVDLARAATASAPPKRPSHYRTVGRSLPRLDLAAKVTGAAFIHDIAPGDVLHARMLRRPWRGARLVHLDEAAVRRAAGAPIDVLREGDLVAFVAEQEIAAMRASQAARTLAQWEGGVAPPPDADDREWLLGQPSRDRVVESGSTDVAAGNRVVEATYSRRFLTYGSIGPSCALAEFRDGMLTVWTHSQGVFALRDWLARTLKLSPDRVSVFHRQGAGCYGHNSADDAAFDAAFVATRRPNRTVRVQWTREDEFLAAPLGPAMAVKLRAVLDAEMRPADWTIEIWSPIHGGRPGANGSPNLLGAEALPDASPPPAEVNDVPDARGGGATRNGEALYDLPHRRLVHHLLADVPVRTSSLRSLGAYANVFAIESFMDELADIAGADPVTYRLSLTSDPRARQVIESAAEMSDWFAAGDLGGDRARGFAFARYKNRAAYVAIVAEVEVETEVKLTRVWACVDAGLLINPDGAANQVEGGIIQAASWALKEQVRFADGRVAASTWDAYPILRFSEVPEIELSFVTAPHEPALGIGEVAMGPTVAAIANGVARALGSRIRDLPLTRERIMATLLGESSP